VSWEYTLDELGDSLESGRGPGGGFRDTVVVVAVLTLEIVEAEEDATGRAWRIRPRFRTEALSDVESLALSSSDLPREGREAVLGAGLLGEVCSGETRSSTPTSNSAGCQRLGKVTSSLCTYRR
jgi:hypothetical protein